jgi:hypothetical protein
MSSGATERLNKILEIIGRTGKKVLLVEGEDDVSAYEALFNNKDFEWEDKWLITHANGKQKVIDILKASNEPAWLGLIDRDEWSEERITRETNALSNLLVLPRYCLENYLVCPDELWEALPRNQQATIGELSKLQEEILKKKNKWIRHGVLWSIINPLWEGMRELGFKDTLLDLDNAQDNDKIKDTLNNWHDFLEPEDIFNNFEECLRCVMEKDEAEQLKRWVHGKRFYREHVTQVLNQFFEQKDANTRKNDLLHNYPWPSDLDFVCEKMGLGLHV